MSTKLMNIKHQNTLKSIFYFLNYEHILKLIKNNKQIQTSLGIDNLSYKKHTSYRYFTSKKIYNTYIEDNDYDIPIWKQLTGALIGILLGFILFVYSLVFASLLASKGAFNENNTKDNYNKYYFSVIHRINLSLFGFFVYILISHLFTFCIVPCNCEHDHGGKKTIKKFVMIIIVVLYLLYDIIIIIKLDLSYKIKKDKITWFMICDYILIFLIALYLCNIIFIMYLYFEYSGDSGAEQRAIILQKFRDIKILDYKLPHGFDGFNEYQKRMFILKYSYDYEIELTKEQKALINSINDYRKENRIDKLHYNEVVKFEKLIFEHYSEPILNVNENIFKFSKGKYLLKYSLNDFKIRFNNRESNIINILKNDYLNEIIIVDKNNNSYIFIYHSPKKKI